MLMKEYKQASHVIYCPFRDMEKEGMVLYIKERLV